LDRNPRFEVELLWGRYGEVNVVRETKSTKLVLVEDNYIFYTCLVLVLAIAAFGLATDLINR
jgi:hypothetical protein